MHYFYLFSPSPFHFYALWLLVLCYYCALSYDLIQVKNYASINQSTLLFFSIAYLNWYI